MWHPKRTCSKSIPTDAENRGLKDRRLGEASPVAPARLHCAPIVTDRVAPGVVYTTFHHPATQANVVTTDFSDWATNCPEYKVTAVQITPSNGPTDWQESYEAFAERSRRIVASLEAAE